MENNMKMYLEEMVWVHGLDLSYSGKKKVVFSCEGDKKAPGFLEIGEFLD
jgi:hypothetical protein